MREPIENEYFNWLCAKVLEPGDSNYLELLQILHKTEFICVVHEDTHRAMDGVELRRYFTNETGNDRENGWFTQPTSVLEVLISFANICNFETDISVKDWFWEFIANLRLDEYRRVEFSDIPVIEKILDTFIMRRYDANGNGGLFPLRNQNDHEDQRNVEIWYQWCAYVRERGLF